MTAMLLLAEVCRINDPHFSCRIVSKNLETLKNGEAGRCFGQRQIFANGYVLAKAAFRNFQISTNCPAAFANTMLAAGAVI